MRLRRLFAPYQEALLTNGTMLAILVGVYTIGRFGQSFAMLLLFLLLALLFAAVELLLFLGALATSRFRLAAVYGILCLLVAKLDWWLLEQFE